MGEVEHAAAADRGQLTAAPMRAMRAPVSSAIVSKARAVSWSSMPV